MDIGLYNHVAASNNLAVDLMKKSNYESAIQVLRMILEILSSKENESIVQGSERSNQQPQQPTEEVDMLETVSFSDNRGNQPLEYQHNLLQVFDRPCSLLHLGATSSYVFITMTDETTHIVLFNLGLCFHLWAMTSANRQTQRLQKALHQYEHALVILDHLSPVNTPKGYLFRSILLNNMACLHLFSFRRAEASECLRALANLIQTRQFRWQEGLVNGYAHCGMNVAMSLYALTASAPAA